MGYIVSEGVYPSWVIKDEEGNLLPEEIDATFRYRSTEIYKRDDGDGGREWKMWHFHCSTRPDDDAVPDAKTTEDTARKRGLGNTPYSQEPPSNSEPSQAVSIASRCALLLTGTVVTMDPATGVLTGVMATMATGRPGPTLALRFDEPMSPVVTQSSSHPSYRRN